MDLTKIAAGIGTYGATSKWIRALGIVVRSIWKPLATVHRRQQRGDHERYLAGSNDCFELERRERAWMRRRDGSLLGW
jgi:hypothetical protein